VPQFARQVSYPVQERHGHIFFFNGRKPLFPLPFFSAGDEQDFVAAKPFRFDVEAPWYVNAANAFDMQHFNLVHSRQLVCEPETDCPAPFARRIRYRSKVVGSSVFDRLLRSLAGDSVDVSITSWGGNFFLVTASFRKAQSYILFDVQPVDRTRTTCYVLVFLHRKRMKLFRSVTEPISLWVRRQFTKAFVLEDPNCVGTPAYSPGTLIASDRAMIEYYHWAASLPQTADECPRAGRGDTRIHAERSPAGNHRRPADLLQPGE
jgi:phenylpropionate dioxygenase-like ring-hydroxylating dioxygenase large terminal subunit